MKKIKHAKNNIPNKEYWSYYLTVGQLKKFIKDYNISDDALILHQRIEDVYFEKHGWDRNSIKKPDCIYPNDY